MNHKEIDAELKALRKKSRLLLLLGPIPCALIGIIVAIFKIKFLLILVSFWMIPSMILLIIQFPIGWKIFWLHIKKMTTVDEWEKKQ